ncbi:MAG: MFS transporter [Chloroflexi bacterium]|nr:MFS transporter [Chloroflexota bacterium]
MTGPPTLPLRRPLAARLLPSRYYYGWYVVVGVAFVMLCGVGVGYYGLAVFLNPLQQAHGWSNASVSGATALYFVVSGVSAAVVGPPIDRRGPMPFLVVGVILTAVTVGCIGFVEELWQLYAVYVVLAASFGMAGGVSTNVIMARWFIRRRARAMSISATGVSSAGVILPPLCAWLIASGGLELTTPVIAAFTLVLGLPVIFLVLVWDPSQMRLPPDGAVPQTGPPPSASLSDEVQTRRWTLSQAMRTLSFWAVAVAFVLVLLAQTGFLIHEIAFLEDRTGSRTAASLALSFGAIGSIVARLIVGGFADALNKRYLTAALFVWQAASVLLVVHIDTAVTNYVFAFTFGVTIGNIYMMQSLLTSEIFGYVSFGAVFGMISLASQVSSGAGPLLVGLLEQATGSYEMPFLVTAGITLAAALVVLLARPVLPLSGDQSPSYPPS